MRPLIWIAALLCLCIAPLARAQDGSITLTLDKFGVGNTSRRGETAGIRLLIADSSGSNRNIVIRLARKDPDGDTIEAERIITTNPGVQQGVWLYTRVPYGMEYNAEGGFTAFAYQAVDVDNPKPGEPIATPGKLLARVVIQPAAQTVQPRSVGLIALTGSARLGLDRYAADEVTTPDPWQPSRGEITRSVNSLRIADMPDQWYGWSQYEALIWTSGEPSELKGEYARAIREWVERGGHLIIVMPAVGQTWTNRQADELFSILPAVSIKRTEGVDLNDYRQLLVGRKDAIEIDQSGNQVATPVSLPTTTVVHTFTPAADAGPGDAIRILNGPDGQCVVVRRLVGLGAVTLVGLDLVQGGVSGAINAQAFWHRILGKRGKLPMKGAADSNMRGISSTVLLDAGIASELNAKKQGESAAGLLLGFVLFIVYWLVAGPVGFAILKRP